jgi:hypothetical protein
MDQMSNALGYNPCFSTSSTGYHQCRAITVFDDVLLIRVQRDWHGKTFIHVKDSQIESIECSILNPA